ncbi:MAG TPA: hypothetical protein VGP41_06925 [Candidatus Lustribacter sp.]|jgi:hypothetical protein|nr:hypothetical protein [Candidatus Lustribacter sp.]
MKQRFLTAAIISLLVGASAATAVRAQDIPKPNHYLPDVKVLQCFVTVPKHFSKKASGTQIVYVNMGTRPLSSVTFAVGYRNSAENFVRKVVDQGMFAPGVKVNHHFDLYSDVEFGGKATTLCGAIAGKH